MADRSRDPIVRTVPQPADMNGNGDIFGGWVLSQMDVAGGALAASRSATWCRSTAR
jgi:acyl-CoA thioesterase YciA